MSEHHQEGLAHLLYGINQGGGFVALTGEVGTGKTTLCHCLLQQLPDNIDIALVLNPKLNAIELLATLCDELHISYDQDKQTLKNLVDRLNSHLLAAHAKGRRTVLVIDEAQNLSFNVLEQIRLLTNLETSTTKLLQIILLGQPELKQLLEKPALRQLNQRITARYHLTSLSYADTQKYIKHRLKLCGGQPGIFNRFAIKKIFTLSQGVPRLINILCDRALLGAYVNGTYVVTVKIINNAAKEVFNPIEKTSLFSVKSVFVTCLIIFTLLGIKYYLIPNQSQAEHVILAGSFKPNVDTAVTAQPGIKAKDQLLPIEPLNLQNHLQKSHTSLTMATAELAKLWGKHIPSDAGCNEIEETGLKCLLDQSDWNALKALNRPVIMEFSLPEAEKHYALLVGLDQENPVFLMNEKISFPLEQVLNLWNGYYLMLWQPPVKNITTVIPGTSSLATPWIRSHLDNAGIKFSGSLLFDDNLKQAVLAFQNKKPLTSDGIVGPRTFIHLKNTDPLNSSPKLN